MVTAAELKEQVDQLQLQLKELSAKIQCYTLAFNERTVTSIHINFGSNIPSGFFKKALYLHLIFMCQILT